jgi:hypothetical protein
MAPSDGVKNILSGRVAGVPLEERHDRQPLRCQAHARSRYFFRKHGTFIK